MIHLKKVNDESGSFSPLAIFVTVVAICAATGAAFALAPTVATRAVSASVSAPTAYAGPIGYFPDQFINQATEIEPLPPTF